MRRALLTGGAGFIGSHLAEALLDAGFAVRALDDLSTGRRANVEHLLRRPGFALTEGSVLDASVVERYVAGCDVVLHLAAGVGVERVVRAPVATIETNVVGTYHVLRAAAHHRRRVLMASSSEIYGKSEAVPFAEQADRLLGPTTQPRFGYAASKAVGEHLALAHAQEHGLAVTVFRPFNTVGPRQTGRYGMVVPRFVHQALEGLPLTVHGDGLQRRSFCDVRDVVRAVLLLLEHPGSVGEVFNVGSPDEITILDLARRVLRATGVDHPDARIRFVPYEQAYAPGFEDMRRRQPDVEKIRRLTGWTPTIRLEETLRELLASRVGSPVAQPV